MAILKTPSEVEVIAGLLAAGGIALVLSGLSKGGTLPPGDSGSDAFGPLAAIRAGESLGAVTNANIGVGVTPIQVGNLLALTMPVVSYAGPGRDTYTYFRIVQQQYVYGAVLDPRWITVQGSGVAGVHIGPSANIQNFPLVSPDEVQPEGAPPQSLVAYPYPGPTPTPIAGARPQLGRATALLEIYQRGSGADGSDGFASPTMNGRIPIRRSVYMNAILYT